MKLIYYASVVFLYALAGCKKDKDQGPPDSNCKIVTVALNASGTLVNYTLSYNNDGKVSKIVVGDQMKTRVNFLYSTNEVVREEFSDHWDGQLTAHTTMELNGMGLPVKVIEKDYDYVPQGQPPKLLSTRTSTFDYNSKGELQSAREIFVTIFAPGSNYDRTTTYTWENGNVIKQQAGAEVADITYYTDKAIQKGDYLTIDNFLTRGFMPFKNKNLIRSLKGGPVIMNINYEFDDQGKVKAGTLSGTGAGTTKEYRYGYSCN